MQKSSLRDKSEIFIASAQILHDQYFYPCVPHAAYYSCYQMMMYIWLYSMGKSEKELELNVCQAKRGSHEYLLNEIIKHINKQNKNSEDSRNLRNKIPQLKRLRVEADYRDIIIDVEKSRKAIELSKMLLSILKRY